MNPNNIITNSYIDYTINVANDCATDIVSVSSITLEGSAYTQSVDVVYYIEDTTKTFLPTWSESVVGCPLEHTLLIEDSTSTYVDYTT